MTSASLFANTLYDVDVGDGRSFTLVANGYRSNTSSHSGFTLILAHGAGHQKELWEPTIEDLLSFPIASSIREIWSFDMLSHGQAAQVNARQLQNNPITTLVELGKAMADFIRQRLRGHKIIGIGHSAGSTAILHIPRFLDYIPFTSIILVETLLISPRTEKPNVLFAQKYLQKIKKMTLSRQRTWENRDALVNFLKNTAPWSSWEARVFDQYTSKGIRPVNPPDPNGTWTMTTSPEAETSSYTEYDDTALAGAELEKTYTSVPVHLVFSATKSMAPPFLQKGLIGSPDKPNVASVTYMPDVGHWIPQEKPYELATIFAQILGTIPVPASANL